MKIKSTFFNNQLSRQTFITLVLGFIIIQMIALFLFFVYTSLSLFTLNQKQLVNHVEHAVSLAESMPLAKLPRLLSTLEHTGFNTHIRRHQPRNVKTFELTDRKVLYRYIKKHPEGIHIAFQVSDQHWLTIDASKVQHNWLLSGIILASVILLVILLLLCSWAITRMSMPMGYLAAAVKRFGLDVQAPPLAEAGPPDMQEVAKAFNEMQGRVRRLINDRTQMLAAISHDLRTPITRLQLRVESLQGTKHYERALNDLKEMEQMISSILSFARDYVRTESMQRFDLDALLESLCNDYSDSGQQVTYHGTTERILMLGRLSALKRALTNLIDNALKYGSSADITLKTTNNQLHIQINDEGPGIPPSELENVFKPFYRVDPARSPEISGSGLGMAVARDIIRAHGGEITLINRKPKGLTVLISMPITTTEKE